jgi:predicted acetyltransferase
VNTNNETLRLIEPAVDLCDAYTDLVLDFRAAGRPFHPNYFDDLLDFGAFVRRLRHSPHNLDLPTSEPTTMHLWAVRGHTIVATVSLRRLAAPAETGCDAHLTCHVRPSERRATSDVLALVAERAGELGLRRLRLTPEDEPVARPPATPAPTTAACSL